MLKIIFLLLSPILWMETFAQGVGINTDGSSPHSSAMLDVNTTSKGVLLPRMSSSQRKAITGPATGLLVFDTDKNCLYLFDGLNWDPIAFSGTTSVFPVDRVATDGHGGDEFGAAVSISGDYAIVGSYRHGGLNALDGQGAAYIFYRSNGNWIQQARLQAADGITEDWFGVSVSIDGDYAVVGASQKGNGPAYKQGAAYIFSRNGSAWTQQAKLTASDGEAYDFFGCSVSVSGSMVVIGASGDDIGSLVTAPNQGSAYIFIRNGTNWTQQQKIVASDGGTGDAFGTSVSIQGNAVAIGAPYDDNGLVNSDQGSVYTLSKSGTTWTQTAKLRASDGTVGDHFGSHTLISNSQVFVGCPTRTVNSVPNAGVLYIYNIGSGFSEQKLYAPEISSQSSFGVSFSASGTSLLVGASYYSGNLLREGKVYLYNLSGVTPQLVRTISDANPRIENLFGSKVGVSGFNLIIAANGDANTGKVSFLNVEQ